MFRFFTRFPFPIRAGGPHTHQPPSGNSQKTAKPTPRRPHTAAHASQIPMRLGSPYGPRSHTFPRLPNATSKLQKSRHWFRRDQRLRPRKSDTRRSPQIPCADGGQPADGVNVWHRFAMRRRRLRRSRSLRSSRPEGRRLRPKAWIPEESGQVGLGKSPQTRRRIAQDGWQITPARPGVMLAPGFAASTSMLYHVFLEASR